MIKISVLNLLFALTIAIPNSATCQNKSNGKITGQLFLDSFWQPVFYLSYIDDFNSMYSMSNNSILQKVNINSNGQFSFDLNYLPVEDNLYRIHFVKKGDPSASIIIGGNEENHFFIIANRFSSIKLTNTLDNNLINQISILNSPINQQLIKINEVDSYIDSMDWNSSQIKREFIKKAIYEKYRFIADTSKHPLISLHAIYKSKFESNYSLNPIYYENYAEKWSADQSSYFNTFRKQLPIQTRWQTLYYFGIGISTLILGFFIGRKNIFKLKKTNHLNLLTVQERKILFMIRDGLSNQEISDKCHIGLSTVKSHVSNIYGKLKIKSRKEAINKQA